MEKNRLRIISKLKIDNDWLTTFGYNNLQTKDNVWFTYNPRHNPNKGQYTQLFRIEDKRKGYLYSQLVVKDTFDFGDYRINKTQHFGINHLGQITFVSDNEKGKSDCTVGIISQDFKLLDSLKIEAIGDNEIFGHNAFPIDENNSFYVLTTKRLIRVDWDGKKLSVGFEARYDFVNDGPTGRWAEGSGTTPTLMGYGEDQDQLIVMADGHAKNNLVAFWREIPSDWIGIPGEDRRLAGKIQLPAAETFDAKYQSIENSPTVYGYDVAIAQFNGFLGQGNNPKKGVQKVHWDTRENKFEIAWVNKDINMNGVLTYSVGSNLVYGSGREDDCNYYYYGLNWETGELEFRKHLGKSCKNLGNPYDDGGCNNILDERGSIYFAGGASLIKLEITKRGVENSEGNDSGNNDDSPQNQESENLIKKSDQIEMLYPNPSDNYVDVIGIGTAKGQMGFIYNTIGQLVSKRPFQNPFYVGDLQTGLYYLKFNGNTDSKIFKLLKR